MNGKPLTKQQRTILEAILFLIGKGELPTVREVGSLVGLRSPATVLKHLRVLEKASLISVSGKSRGIRISDRELLDRVIQSTAGEIDPLDSTGSSDPLAGSPPTGPRFSSSPSASSAASSAASSGRSPHDRRLDDVLQTHLPGVARLASLSTPFTSSRSGDRGTAGNPPRKIPLVGAIAAGQPFESYSDAYVPDEFGAGDCGSSGWESFGYDDFSSSMAPSTGTASPTLGIDPKVFCESGDVLALKVEGDSMVNAGILDGDYAIIRRQSTVEEGEIAAVIINGEGTLKRWTTRHGSGADREMSISLRPENENFDPIEITEGEGKDVLVIGKYVGLVRGIQPIL